MDPKTLTKFLSRQKLPNRLGRVGTKLVNNPPLFRFYPSGGRQGQRALHQHYRPTRQVLSARTRGCSSQTFVYQYSTSGFKRGKKPIWRGADIIDDFEKNVQFP